MKFTVKILGIIFVIMSATFTSTFALAGENGGSNFGILGSVWGNSANAGHGGLIANGSGIGIPPKPNTGTQEEKQGGMIANGNGNTSPPDPTMATTQPLICIQGFCIIIGN
ncbi:hypothetical protein KIH87_11735 [Paraneptunicella aestuarii]|uniref:hypothetical protein n=1 Tax=Paraneptunicella aestuarii TaxID=2831148 RepID=UPI001E5A9FAF|nr:hypothetical protein [Paraneptunicella aestuarii]UAA37385.1 hypothetical protein KIH87_11735 [Paraneptunicella aestuarii]